MTINIGILCWLCLVVNFFVLADNNNVTELFSRLNYIDGFYAQFIQKITDSTGMLLQENKGELWIRRPYSFNYHIIFPEESFLISDGIVLWIYDPCISQVIIYWLKNVLDDTFLMFLTGGLREDCVDKYFINRNGDNFFIVPRKYNNNVVFKTIEIRINNQGIIKNLNILNRDGCTIHYQFMHHDIRLFDIKKFIFIPPEGVQIDEQRK